MPSIFEYIDYRKYLSDWLEERRKSSRRVTITELSKNIKVQQSYLSQVMAGDRDLNQDQAYLLSQFLNLNDEESEVLGLMIEYSRTALTKRKKRIKERLIELRKAQQNVAKHLELDQLEGDRVEFHEFCRDPANQIVYTALSVPEYRRDIKKMSRALGIGLPKLRDVLQVLEKLKLIERHRGQIEVLKNDLHFSRDQWFFPFWNHQTRTMAQGRQLLTPRDSSYEFNVLFTTDEEGRAKIKDEFFRFIGKVRKISEQHESKNVQFLSFDFFKWDQ